MSDFWFGLVLGVFASGVVRISFGRFVIYTSERGWVWGWSRFDEEDERIVERVKSALEIGARRERIRQMRTSD